MKKGKTKMMVNKMLDAIQNPGPGMFVIPKGEELAEIVWKIRAAEKFDFGELMLELNTETTTPDLPRYKVPQLTEEEHSFFDQGLIPTPAPFVWYECKIGGFTSGFLIDASDTNEWKVTRVDFERHQGTGAVDGCWVKEERSDPSRRSFNVAGDPSYLKKCYGEMLEKDLKTGIIMSSAPSLGQRMSHGSNWYLARYMTFMINSRSTKTYRVEGSAPTVAPLPMGKREPRPAHTVVTIVPREYYVMARKEGEATRSPPRLHWRRSHLRTLPSGKKIVIARMLIGRAELGTISHEYRVPAGVSS